VSLLLEQVTQLSDLLLQRGELGLQGAQRRGQGEQWRRPGDGNGRRGFGLRQRGKRALMQTGELTQVVLTQAVFATISGMGLQAEMGLGEPTMQGFGIDAQEPTRVGD
jgi:hypothetical protein